MQKVVHFKADFVGIPDDEEGAARLISHLSKPRNAVADMKKLRDVSCLAEGGRPFLNRSKKQVVEGATDVWGRVSHAIEVGDWFDRMISPKSLTKYHRSLTVSLQGRSKEIDWDPWKPVAHMAAGFRMAMLKTGRGRYFNRAGFSEQDKIDQLMDIMFDDHRWIELALREGRGRVIGPRLWGIQVPKLTRMFVSVPSRSQKSPPD